MKLLKGLVTDVNPIDAPEGSWIFGQNGMYLQQGAISNELGFDQGSHPDGKILIGKIPLPTDDVILFYVRREVIDNELVHSQSEIRVIRDNDTFLTLVLDERLNFDSRFPINGKFKYNNKKDLIIIFTDDYNPPRLINLKNLMLDITLESDKDFNLFLNLKVCKITNISIVNGGSLASGSYQFAFKYKFKDNSETSIFFISNPIPIFKGSSENYNSLEGDEGGKFASKSIKVNLEDLDQDYKSLIVYVIKTVNQIVTAERINEYNISSDTKSILYTGLGSTPVEISEVLTSFASLNKVKVFEVHQDYLFAGNIGTSEINSNYQTYANLIKIKWNAEGFVSVNRVRNSYKDPFTVFIKRGFMPNEVYAIYIRLVLNDGGRSLAYHIPGRIAEFGETNLVNSDIYKKIDGSSKKFHFENTASRDPGQARGWMGYWENETELYPNDEDIWGDLANTPVRHHRFPDLKFISTELGNIIASSEFEDFSMSGSMPPNNSNNLPVYTYIGKFNNIGSPIQFENAELRFGTTESKIYENVSYIIPETGLYDFNLNLSGLISVQFGESVDMIHSQLIIYKGTITNRQQISNSQAIILYTYDNELVVDSDFSITELQFDVGDYVTIAVTISTTEGPLNPSVIYELNLTFNLDVTVGDEEIESGNNGKILGIEVSNIIVPDSIRDSVQGFEILYAQKSLENSQIVGHGILGPQNWYSSPETTEYNKSGRFYSFDMLALKPSTGVSHLKLNYVYGETNNDDVLEVQQELDPISLDSWDHLALDDFEYVPNDNTAVVPSNEFREEYIHLKFKEDIPIELNSRYFLAELHSLKKDVYLSFNNQVLVSTGYIFPINDEDVNYSTNVIYGGDTFMSPYGINLRHKVSTIFSYKTINLWSYSASNIGLRSSDISWDKKYYPISPEVRESWNLIHNDLIPASVDQSVFADVKAAKETMVVKSTDYYSYNLDYSRLNSLSQTEIFYNKQYVEDYPFRVMRGSVSIKESDIETWRNFPAFDYYEMPKEKGEIWNLASLGSVLLIHQEFMLYKTRGNGVLRLQSNDEIQLGDGDIFEFRPDEVIPEGLSYAGTRSMYTCLVCKLGYIFVDQSQGRVFIYDSELKEISNEGNLNFFNTSFKYSGIDNPFLGQGLSAAFDSRYNRILFSFSNASINITISYSLYINSWVFKHSYDAGVLFNTPNKLFSIEKYSTLSEKAVFVHNSIIKKGIYYKGVPEEFIIDIPLSNDYRISKKTLSVSWIMDRVREESFLRDKSFDKIFLYNSFQATDVFDLEHYDMFDGTFRNIKNSWNFDLIRNIGKGGKVVDEENINYLNLDYTKPWFEKEEFEDKYIVVRFIYKNNIQSEEFFIQDTLFLYDVSVNNILKIR